MLRAVVIAVVLLALLAPAYLRGCAGPRPEVLAVSLERTPAGLVPRATIRNDGGPGQVEVRFRIRDVARGAIVAAEGDAHVERGEELDVLSSTTLPPGNYAIDAEAEYPPD